MPGGLFYQPLDLSGLDEAGLLQYARICRSTIEQADGDRQQLQVRIEMLSEGRWIGAVKIYGGLALAILGIATTPLLTPLGLAALAGGALALDSAGSAAKRSHERSLLEIDYQNSLASIAFCRSEQARIKEQLNRIRRRQ